MTACFVLGVDDARSDQRPPDAKAKDYADLLNQLQAKRLSLRAAASRMMQANQYLQQHVFEAEQKAYFMHQFSKDIPEVGLSNSVSVQRPMGDRRSNSRSNSRSELNRWSIQPGDVVTESSSLIDNMPQKRALMRMAQAWKFQSIMNQRSMAILHQQFAQNMANLVGNLNEFVALVDVYGDRCQQESEIAAEITEDWLLNDPTHIGAMLVRSAALRNLGRLELAENLALEAKRVRSPADSCAMTLYAQCLFLRGKTKESEREFEQVTRLARGGTTEAPFVLKALMEAAEGKLDVAMGDIKFACRVNPKSARAWSVRALIECSIDDKEIMQKNSLSHANQSVALLAGDWLGHFAVLAAESKAGNFAAAQRAGENALQHANGEQKEILAQRIAECQKMHFQKIDFAQLWSPLLANAR